MKIAEDVKIPVSLVGIRPEMTAAFPVIDAAYEKLGYEAILTSGTEGKHMVGSLHPKGLATDWRIRHVRVDLIPMLVERIKKNLGGKQSQYDVLLEKDHLHVEFDPD